VQKVRLRRLAQNRNRCRRLDLGGQGMPEAINITLNIQITDGPKVNIAKSIEVEAYTNIGVEVANDAQDVTVQVQPGGVGDVKFLLIASDIYGSALTYSGDGGVTTILLDQPHLFLGSGGAQVSGAPQSIIFNNGLASNANITILVGRDAT
jgi:hypothetical protein